LVQADSEVTGRRKWVNSIGRFASIVANQNNIMGAEDISW
jgi:hypothetical protein